MWVAALAIMSVFQFWRAAPIDGAIFTVVCIGLVVERVLRLRRAASPEPAAPSGPPLTTPLAVVVVVALLVGLAIVVAPRTGVVSITLVAGLGLAAVALVWNRAPDSRNRSAVSRRRSRIAWASVGAAMCLWEALAYILSVAVPRGWIGFPTVSLLLEPAVNFDPTRALLTAAWLALGVWLVVGSAARQSTPDRGVES